MPRHRGQEASVPMIRYVVVDIPSGLFWCGDDRFSPRLVDARTFLDRDDAELMAILECPRPLTEWHAQPVYFENVVPIVQLPDAHLGAVEP